MIEFVSRAWRVYLLGCKHFSAVTDHATLTHLLKQSSDKLPDRQVHWVERVMMFAHCMSILYRKGVFNEADVVSRRPDFFPPDTDVHLRRPVHMFALYGMEKYLIWVTKAMRRHCWYFRRILSPLMMAFLPN